MCFYFTLFYMHTTYICAASLRPSTFTTDRIIVILGRTLQIHFAPLAAQARRVSARYVHRSRNVTRYCGLYDVIAYTCVYDKRCTGDYTAVMYTYVCHPAHVLIIIIFIVVWTRLARARPA